MSAFNEFHYPTMPATTDKMINRFKTELPRRWANYQTRYLKHKSILEPNAGSGAIVDHLVDAYGVEKKDISCIEIDDELRATLVGKGYKVIDSDFLQFDDPIYFDLIVMNPPFRNGVDHCLKAWDIVADNGDVACLLNAETVRNQNSEKRKLLGRLIEQYGSCEYIGSVFTDAERTTDVECVIVWLHKPKRDKTVDFGDGYDQDAFVSEVEYTANFLASNNILESLVAQYEGAKAALIEQHKAEAKYRFYIANVVNVKGEDDKAYQSLDAKIAELKKNFWRYVFDKTEVGRRTTSKVQEEFSKFQVETSNMSFNIYNIRKVRETLLANINHIIGKCLLDTFDKATGLHENNMIHTEGWKTNKSYRLNRKIIVPWGISHDKWGYWSTDWRKCDFYRDLDKVMCFLSGKKYEEIDETYKTIDSRMGYLNGRKGNYIQGGSYDDLIESTFFQIRFFKKGTVHLIFKDQELLDKFNRAAAEGKNWIGGGY